MNSWQRWVQAPQTLLFRRLLFQIHLWTGIVFGLYIILISLTGSALILQPQVTRAFVPNQIEVPDTPALKDQELQDKIEQVYAGYTVYFTLPAYYDDKATYVVLHQGEKVLPRYFNQYTGEDIGPSNPWQVRIFEWFVNIHDDLLLQRTGRKLNGIGGAIFLAMSLSGIILWWQGRSRWTQGLQIKVTSPRGIIWQLHNFIGFWTLSLMICWGLSGFHLGYPTILNNIMSWFDITPTDFRRPSGWLSFMMDIHFAKFVDNLWQRWLWAIAGLLPSILVISGFIIWLKRVIFKNRKIENAQR